MKDALRAAAWTAIFSFVGLFGLSLLGWLQELAAWASSSGREPLPGLSTLGYGLVAAATSAVIGLVNFAVRYAQSRGLVPGTPPSYDERGLTEIGQLALLVGAGVAVAVAVRICF